MNHASPERLTEQTRQAQHRAEQLLHRDLALLELVELLDPAGELSRSKLAEAIATRLSRFEYVAWPRIRTGLRVPQSAVEIALADVLAAGRAQSARRVYDLLVDLLDV